MLPGDKDRVSRYSRVSAILMVCRIVAAALVGAMILASLSPSRADENAFLLRMFFHPWDASELDLLSDCEEPADGSLYVALGRHVFRWPVDRLPMFEELDPAFDAIEDPIPPVPADAYGCPGNPLPVQAIGFDLAADGTRLPSKDGASAFAKLIRLLPGRSWQPWVQLHEEVFQTVCSGPATRTPQGLMRCSSDKSTDPDQKRKNQSRYLLHLKATSDVYSDPFGNAFYIRCSDHTPPHCQVDYAIHEDVVAGYEFRRRQLKLSNVLEFDRALRSLIAAAEVEDFVWHDVD